MPNRILKETICTSEEIDALSADLEVFFYRLMVVCDDYGLMDARPAILKARCYPLKSIDINCIKGFLDGLSRVGLIVTYEVDGRPYLSIVNWKKHQQIRAHKAKYPAPDDVLKSSDINGYQQKSDAPVIQSNPIQSNPDVIQYTQEPDAPKAVRFDAKGELIAMGVSETVAEDFLKLRKGKRAPLTPTALDGISDEAKKAGLSMDAALRESCARGWQGFKAEWVAKNGGSNGKNGSSGGVRDTIAKLTGADRHFGNSERVVEGTAIRVD